MFSKKVIGTDRFSEMNLKSQLLYFHLNMDADDDGFIGNPKKHMRSIGATQKHYNELADNGYIISFDSGVAVISHWRIHNLMRKDRYTPTVYTEEMKRLEADENNVYILATKWQPNGNQTAPQDKLSKDKLSKVNISECDKTAAPSPPTPGGEFQNVILTEDEYERLKERFSNCDRTIERLSQYMAATGKQYNSHYAVIKQWATEDENKVIPPTTETDQSFDVDEFYQSAINKDIWRALT